MSDEGEEEERPAATVWRSVPEPLGGLRWSRDRWEPERWRPPPGYRSAKAKAGPKVQSRPMVSRAANDNARPKMRAEDMPPKHGDYELVAIEVIGRAGRFVVVGRCTAGQCGGRLTRLPPGKWVSRSQLRCAKCNRYLQGTAA